MSEEGGGGGGSSTRPSQSRPKICDETKLLPLPGSAPSRLIASPETPLVKSVGVKTSE